MSKDYSKINDLTQRLQSNLRQIYEDDRTIYNTYKSVDNIDTINNLVGLPASNEVDSYMPDIINLFDNNTFYNDLLIDGNLSSKQITTNDILLPIGPLSEQYQTINDIQKSINNIQKSIDIIKHNLHLTKKSPLNISKTFVIQHPLKTDNYLVHACLEGPEAGVYYRGEGRTIIDNSVCIVELPPYAEKIASHFSIHLTPILDNDHSFKNSHSLLASRVQNGSFSVWSKYKCNFFWIVYGRRITINVEPLKSDYDIKGNGPYNWLEPSISINNTE